MAVLQEPKHGCAGKAVLVEPSQTDGFHHCEIKRTSTESESGTNWHGVYQTVYIECYLRSGSCSVTRKREVDPQALFPRTVKSASRSLVKVAAPKVPLGAITLEIAAL